MEYKQAYKIAMAAGWDAMKRCPNTVDKWQVAQKAFEAVMSAYGFNNEQGEYAPCNQ